MIKSMLFALAVLRGGCDHDGPPSSTPKDGGTVATAKGGSAATDESFNRYLAEKIGKPKPAAPTRAGKQPATASPAVKPDPAAKPDSAAKPDPAVKEDPEVKPDPAAKPKPAKKASMWAAYGKEMGPELMDYPQFENDKEGWDYRSERVDYGQTYYGRLWVLHRCDDRDGCQYKVGRGANWTDIGWYLQK
jgi:hypothetical protein